MVTFWRWVHFWHQPWLAVCLGVVVAACAPSAAAPGAQAPNAQTPAAQSPSSSAHGNSPADAASSQAAGGASASALIGPIVSATPEQAALITGACPLVVSLEEACRAALNSYPAGCAPQDCTLDTVASAHGVSVHLLTIPDFVCGDECSGAPGVLGRSPGTLSKDECGVSETRSYETSQVFIQVGNRIWPAMTLESFNVVWNELTTTLSDVEIPDGESVLWTLNQNAVSHIESDGGDGGDVTVTSASRVFVWLAKDGPRIRHLVTLFDREVDNTGVSQIDGESDEEFAEREVQHTAPQDLAARPAETPVIVPNLSELPRCGGKQPCPVLCAGALRAPRRQ